ncbi:MAG TPA: hypothetical protein VF054_00525, partial [Micromonosporaceae bacterium]
MSIQLPSSLVWVIDLLGYNWPEADEDALHAAGRRWRAFARDLREVSTDADRTATDLTRYNTSASIDAFAAGWQRDRRWHEDGADAGDLIATLLDASGMATRIAKIAILGILAVTAAQIVAAQVAAPETLGASEAEAVAAEEAGRYAVRRVLDKLRHTAVRHLAGELRTAIEDRLHRITPELARTNQVMNAVTGSGGRRLAGAVSPGREIPLGFADHAAFRAFTQRLHGGLEAAGYRDTKVLFAGSSVTGQRFLTGEAFDVGRPSDFDIALVGDDLWRAASEIGVTLRGRGTRT